ncbi:hypothetical protein [Methylobacterium platani]|uniref:hypothetical protein n=1 Tax=Methylobacterium platani TaxID=427683 RepID=UPI001428AE49|nr:hypothetical protein [Methylobacterium platani]
MIGVLENPVAEGQRQRVLPAVDRILGGVEPIGRHGREAYGISVWHATRTMRGRRRLSPSRSCRSIPEKGWRSTAEDRIGFDVPVLRPIAGGRSGGARPRVAR